jgi:hypothetical protein
MLQTIHCLPQVQCHNCHEKKVDIKHGALLMRYVEEVNICFRPSLEHESPAKCLHVTTIVILDFSFL